MKKLFLILSFILLATFSFGQTVYATPQTVQWDAPTNLPTVGIIEYEVFLIRIFDGSTIPSNIRNDNDKYTFLGKISNLAIIVDLQATGLQGDFVIAIRTTYTYNEVISVSGFAYSDVGSDVFPIDETFYLRYLGGAINGVNKPTMIRFNGGI